MRSIFVLAGCVAIGTVGSAWAAKVGSPAPDFAVAGADGKTYKLADFKGKWLVLEWQNHGCPYVKKHYNSGNMQKRQKELTSRGAAWLTVISTNKNHKDYLDPKAVTKYMTEKAAAPTAVLMDSDSKMGRAYEAKTTPHMFLIDPKGQLVYNGAIDDNDSSDAEDAPKAKNYVLAAFNEASAGKPVTTSATKPYGCGVKFPD